MTHGGSSPAGNAATGLQDRPDTVMPVYVSSTTVGNPNLGQAILAGGLSASVKPPQTENIPDGSSTIQALANPGRPQ